MRAALVLLQVTRLDFCLRINFLLRNGSGEEEGIYMCVERGVGSNAPRAKGGERLRELRRRAEEATARLEDDRAEVEDATTAAEKERRRREASIRG